MISKIAIRNFRCFRSLDVSLTSGMNVLVGRNGAGKSTLLEAVHLALTGRLGGRLLGQALSPYLINLAETQAFVAALQGGARPDPPRFAIDLFFDAAAGLDSLRGTNNELNEDACGVHIEARLSEDFRDEYNALLDDSTTLKLPPTEYYRIEWCGFSGNPVTRRSLPSSVTVIDPADLRLHSGVDYHLQQIIDAHLSPNERAELSRQYRSLREAFADNEAVQSINGTLAGNADEDRVTDRQLTMAIDISHRYTWESGVVAHLDDVPLSLAGRGEQHSIKTLLAVGRRIQDVNVVLLEEPETHLSHAGLRRLLRKIEERCKDKQVLIATHSTFVLNKLGLDRLLLLDGDSVVGLSDLSDDTSRYFKKLAGFDTLRLVLAEKSILVEGASDELVVQRAYQDQHGRMPLEDGIDVISIGLSHKRFAELSRLLGRRVWLVTDNDGRTREQMELRFDGYLVDNLITLHTGSDPTLRTMEPEIVHVNTLATLNDVLGLECESTAEVLKYMVENKTEAALAIFDSPTLISMPEYIRDVCKGE